jgi:hypothetical protein
LVLNVGTLVLNVTSGDADPDVPILKEAKAPEYEKLQ